MSATRGWLHRMGAALDAAVTVVAPAAGARRKGARLAEARLAALPAYRGAGTDRLKQGWPGTGGSADQDLLPDLSLLRQRSRDLARNDLHAAGALKRLVDQVIGDGILPQARLRPLDVGMTDRQARDAGRVLEGAWEAWSEDTWADAHDRCSLSELQALVERQVLDNGDCLVLPTRREDPGRPFSLALEVVEADRLATPTDLRTDEKMREGVEVDKQGRPVAYWVRERHPGDLSYGPRSWGNSSADYRRIPARDAEGRRQVWHVFEVLRPGQSRGEPFFAPALRPLKDLADYQEAELVAARVAACFALFIQKADPGSGLDNESEVQGTRRLEEIEPGMITRMGIGETVNAVNPARPGSPYDAYVARSLKSLASALGLTYEVLAGDFERTNFSSAKASLLLVRRFFQRRQQLHVRRWLTPAWQLLVEECFLRGGLLDLPARDFSGRFRAWTRVQWVPPAWGWLDPAREAEASRAAVNNGTSTLADECAAQGKDWEEVLEQRALEEVRRKELGLPMIPPPPAGIAPEEPKAAETPAPEPAPEEPVPTAPPAPARQ